MDVLLSALCFCALSAVAVANIVVEGPCFQFPGDSYIHFTPNNFDNRGSAHYSLRFRTSAENGIILYARGVHGDDEALYIRGGKLTYHLYNAGPHGLGHHFGGFFQSDENVNTGGWVTVHLFRSFGVQDPTQMRIRDQTGFVVEINGVQYNYLDFLPREDIWMSPTVYIGGYREQLSDTVGYFQGEIKDIREFKNGHVFEEPSLNYMSRVGRQCHDYVPQ